MQWLEITVNTSHDDIDELSQELTLEGVQGLITEDQREIDEFLEENRQFWDYVDQDFYNASRGVSRIKFYLEDSQEGRRELERLSAAFPQYRFLTRQVRDEDWENNWKAYYKPIEVGNSLMIVPQWEEAPQGTGRSQLRLDPGLIFGTGSHATTKMCLMAIEKYLAPGAQVLDLGCGSGILSIAALILGAGGAVGCDIDDKAPSVVMENAALNGVEDSLEVFSGDVTGPGAARRLEGRRFQLVLANIVADVIIAIAGHVGKFLEPEGYFICSGIIDGRQGEVKAALQGAGFNITESMNMEDWHAFVCNYGGGDHE